MVWVIEPVPVYHLLAFILNQVQLCREVFISVSVVSYFSLLFILFYVVILYVIKVLQIRDFEKPEV